MSAVHDKIAMQALSVQSEDIKEQFQDYIHEFKESSWYPDYFADLSMSQEAKDKIDPEADRFIYPLPPKTELNQKFAKYAKEEHFYSGESPFEHIYHINFYLKNAIESLQKGDIKSAIKFCGVYSHALGDTGEPIHAMSPALLDVIVPPPKEFLGFELHANVEGLKAPVKIDHYKPKLLGENLKQAEMEAFSGLLSLHRFGAAQATPIVQALYAYNKEKAMELSSLAQSETAKHFADFIFTVFSIANGNANKKNHTCDLRKYPYLSNTIDMTYRYQPIIDASLIPYSGGKMHPLALMNKQNTIVNLQGLGVVPNLAPPCVDDHIREADIEYFLVPGAYKEFSARIGLNPLFEESMPSAKFQILGDGKILAESAIVQPGDVAESITAELGNTRFLTLRMSYVHTPHSDQLNTVSTHLAWVSHGVWGEPVLR
ncbi:MAG: NPCBM/NEW2 domain-containing protein [Verrucomicrobiota bacterium]|nr:NPCBM/NEW2 domain-containing protein [Verrucomicrobiota bacterium]